MTRNDVFDAFTEYYNKGLFISNPTILLLDLPTKSELEKGIKSDILQSDYFLVFGVSSYSDIKVGATFDCLFQPKDIEHFVPVEAVLKYVSINRSYETDLLSQGHSGICAFEFRQKRPILLDKLPLFNTKRDSLIHDSLILTQRYIVDKLLSSHLSYFNNQKIFENDQSSEFPLT